MNPFPHFVVELEKLALSPALRQRAAQEAGRRVEALSRISAARRAAGSSTRGSIDPTIVRRSAQKMRFEGNKGSWPNESPWKSRGYGFSSASNARQTEKAWRVESPASHLRKNLSKPINQRAPYQPPMVP